MMGSKPYHSLLNSLHCSEGWLKPSHRGHWMCFESRSNKRSYKEGKSKFTGFQQIQQTSIRIQKHTGFNSTALWVVKLCLFLWIQAGRKGFSWLWHGARWFAFPQLSAFGNRNWLLPALPPAPAPAPSFCLPTVWLELPSSQLLSLHSLPWQPLRALLIQPSWLHKAIPGPYLFGCLHYNVCPNKLWAFEIGCGMQQKWSLLGSSNKWSVHFSEEILKRLWTPARQVLNLQFFFHF